VERWEHEPSGLADGFLRVSWSLRPLWFARLWDVSHASFYLDEVVNEVRGKLPVGV